MIGIDTQFQKGVIQAVSIASEDKVAVFDLSELRENATIIEYLTKILQSDSIEKIAHSFKLDAYYLSKLLGIDGTTINKVIDLSTNIVEESEESVRKIGLNKLAEKYLEKSLNQYYKKSNWSERPFEQALIDYVALNGFVVLKLFLEYTKSADHSEPKYFEYEEPSNLPEFKESGETTKRARSENRPRKNTEERSRRRRTAPKKNAADDTQKNRVKKTDSDKAPAKKTRFVNEKSDQDTKKHSTRNGGEAKTGTRPTTRTRDADHTGASEGRPRNRVRGRGGRN